MVAVPPLLVSAAETGRLSAGNFLVGYTVAFVVPMIGGLVSDASGDIRHAFWVMIAYGVLVLPIAFNLKLERSS
jgi:CP family cyanate transporter-like MFS transporter